MEPEVFVWVFALLAGFLGGYFFSAKIRAILTSFVVLLVGLAIYEGFVLTHTQPGDIMDSIGLAIGISILVICFLMLVVFCLGLLIGSLVREIKKMKGK